MNRFHEKKNKKTKNEKTQGIVLKTATISLQKIMNFFTYVGLRFSGSVEGILCKARPTEEETRLLRGSTV